MLRVEEQRKPALRADVFVIAVAIGELFVIVLAEEARQRVTNVRDGFILTEVLGPASTPARRAGHLLEDVVIDVMSEDEARESG